MQLFIKEVYLQLSVLGCLDKYLRMVIQAKIEKKKKDYAPENTEAPHNRRKILKENYKV